MVLHAVRLISSPTVEKFRRGSGLCPVNRETACCPRGHASHARSRCRPSLGRLCSGLGQPKPSLQEFSTSWVPWKREATLTINPPFPCLVKRRRTGCFEGKAVLQLWSSTTAGCVCGQCSAIGGSFYMSDWLG